MASASISVPRRALIFSGSSFSVVSSKGFGTTSITPGTTSPAPRSSISSQARSTAFTVFCISRPFSKREEASVRMPRAVAVRRTDGPLKQALSKRTIAVSPTISEFSPPMTPATATGFSVSQMQSISGVRFLSVPSSVRITSPGLARRTRISLLPTQEKSKACIGWPYSIMT